MASAASLVAARTAFGGVPLALNVTIFANEMDPTVPIAGDFDVLVLNLDSWGIPWDSFLYEQPLPISWEARLNASVAIYQATGLPLLLQLPMGDGDSRSCPARNATDAPGSNGAYPSVSPVGGCSSCFDYNEVTNPIASFFRQGFINYALAISYAFSENAPSTETGVAGIQLSIDANRFLEAGCTAAQNAAYLDFANQAYVSVKTAFPSILVYHGFQLESMWGLNGGQACQGAGTGTKAPSAALNACFKKGYAAVSTLSRDAFGISVSPSSNLLNVWAPWLLTAAADALNAADSASVFVTGTTFMQDTIVVNVANGSAPVQALPPPSFRGKTAPSFPLTADPAPECYPFLASNMTIANAWLASVIATAEAYSFVAVTLSAARDVVPAQVVTSCGPCEAPPGYEPFCQYLEALRNYCPTVLGQPSWRCELVGKFGGTGGVRDLLNSPKEPIHSTLQAARTGAWDAAQLRPKV